MVSKISCRSALALALLLIQSSTINADCVDKIHHTRIQCEKVRGHGPHESIYYIHPFFSEKCAKKHCKDGTGLNCMARSYGALYCEWWDNK